MTTSLFERVRADGFLDWPPEPSCLGCSHYRPIHKHASPRYYPGMVCHYLLDTGHSRGCPFGSGCTRWEN